VPAPRYVYATSGVDHSISLFADDVTTGELTRAGQSMTNPASSAPERLVFHPNGRYAYAPDMTSGTVSVFAVDADTGWLEQHGQVTVAAGPHAIAIDPSGTFAYVTNQGSDLLHVFSIDASTGELTQVGTPIGTSFQPSAVQVDPTGQMVFITLKGRDTDGLGSGTVTTSGKTFSLPLTPAVTDLAERRSTSIVSNIRIISVRNPERARQTAWYFCKAIKLVRQTSMRTPEIPVPMMSSASEKPDSPRFILANASFVIGMQTC